MTDSAALQQQYYPWYQQTQQHYPGYTYPYNYYYPMSPVSTVQIYKFSVHNCSNTDNYKTSNLLNDNGDVYEFQYGTAYTTNQYAAPPNPFPGATASNGQVNITFYFSHQWYHEGKMSVL